MSLQAVKRVAPVLVSIAALSFIATSAHADTPVFTIGAENSSEFIQASATASALVGEVAPNPNTNVKLPFGVFGEYDASQTQFGIGVLGISTTGYGVGAEAFGSNPTIFAEAAGAGDGLDAIVPSNNAASQNTVDAENHKNGPALDAIAYDGNAVEASASGSDASALSLSSTSSALFGIFATNSTDVGEGIHVESTNSEAVVARSTSGSYGVPVALIEDYASGGDVLDAFTQDSQGNSETPLRIVNPSANDSGFLTDPSVDVDVHLAGDAFVQGDIFVDCGEYDNPSGPGTETHCSNSLLGNYTNSPDPQYTTYNPQEADATIEDTGEAKLLDGRAHVTLQSGFRSSISSKKAYTVFTTANGESNGLYITNKTAKGFDVRENDDGRSSIAFDYRIIGHPRLDSPHRSARNRTAGPTERAPAAILAQDAQAERFKAKLARDARPRSFFNLVR